VSAYPGATVMRVVVAEGEVALGITPNAPLMTLRAGDLATLDTAGVATLTQNADLAPFMAWKDGTLAFNGTPLHDVLIELGRWYDLDLRLADTSLSDRPLTATFTDEPARQVVERIARVLHLEAHWEGHRVTLSSGRSTHTPR
jgi:transmembrane sensor